MRRYIAVIVLLLAACATSPRVVADRLFCGLSIPSGGTVSQMELDRFVAEVVEPRFPDGFTIWRARGAWRGGEEEVIVLEIVHRADPALDEAVREIAREYRRRFRQESVLHVRAAVEMRFVRER